MRVLVVEDNLKLSRFLTQVLAENGYAVDICHSGEDAIERATSLRYDLILLDWMLPDLDGVSVCTTLRRMHVRTPVLMLTARGELKERVLGLDAGADDYLVKPFETPELLARARALLRRASGTSGLRIGDLEVDPAELRVTLKGERLDLTSREYALLLHLVNRVDRIVPKTELLGQVWDFKFDTGSNLIEVQVSRLRDKLGDHAWMIETVRGFGYRLRSRPKE
jgi:DNA-binding response OmpR family regulator